MHSKIITGYKKSFTCKWSPILAAVCPTLEIRVSSLAKLSNKPSTPFSSWKTKSIENEIKIFAKLDGSHKPSKEKQNVLVLKEPNQPNAPEDLKTTCQKWRTKPNQFYFLSFSFYLKRIISFSFPNFSSSLLLSQSII